MDPKAFPAFSHQHRLMEEVQTVMNLCACGSTPPPSPVPVSCISRSFRRSRLLCPLVGSFPSAAGVPVIYPLITGHGRFWESGHKCQTESKCSRFPSALFHRSLGLLFIYSPVLCFAPEILPQKTRPAGSDPSNGSRQSESGYFMRGERAYSSAQG